MTTSTFTSVYTGSLGAGDYVDSDLTMTLSVAEGSETMDMKLRMELGLLSEREFGFEFGYAVTSVI